MRKRRLSNARKRRVRTTARSFVDVLAQQAPLHTVDDFLEGASSFVGRPVVYELSDLEDGVVAMTRLRGDVATVTVSTTCTTVWHSVAHEVGHLALGHSHVAVRCIEQDLDDCPAGFERVHLAMLNPEGEDNPREIYAEFEAEVFATETMRLINTVNEPQPVRVWAAGV